MHTASQALAIERQASAQPSLAERVSRPKTRAILGLMRLNFLSVHRIRADYLNAYQTLVLNEPDSAVSQTLKEAFLALRQAAESGE